VSLVETATSGERWACDGNYSRVREMVWERATAIVWLNYSFPRTFYRAITRTTRRVASGEEVCGGNRESFRVSFMSRDSILLWVLTSYFDKRRRYSAMLSREKLRDKQIFIFRHPRQAEEFLREIERLRN
jgi:hypothetical protein